MSHHPTSWSDRIEVIDGKINRVLTAFYNKGKYDISIDVYKEDEDGNAWMRNAFLSSWGGWVVCFPGLPYNTNHSSWYFDPNPAEIEDWKLLGKRSGIGHTCYCSQIAKNTCILYHSNFSYVLKKYSPESIAQLMDILIMWMQHPEVELPLSFGFVRLAMNKSFYRSTKTTKKKIARFCKDYPEACDFTLREIHQCIKSPKCESMVMYLLTVPSYYRDTINLDDFEYLRRKKMASSEGISLLSDYRRLLNGCEHDAESKYWKYPKDLRKRHDKLLEEYRIKQELERERQKQLKEKQALGRLKKLETVLKKYKKYDGYADGYYVYFPDDYDDWKKQASTLNQCIIYADYIGKVINRKCLLAFIRKDDVPIATVEILPNKKIGQFYADEHDRNNCLPTDETKAAFYKWFENVKVKEVI